jgi:coenzyme F420-0:L-glutamate ligase/coenzyme F420-1:gamma-L-glutamate ligase
MQNILQIIPIQHIKEIKKGDNITQNIISALEKQKLYLENQDIIVITQKIISKAEGQVIDLATIKPSPKAIEISKKQKKDPRYVELILQESKRIVRQEHGVIISETHHGFICANAGIDASNIDGNDSVALLSKDSDASAQKIKTTLEKYAGKNLAIIISDTWGRPWREGQVNFAIGSSGIEVLIDYRGQKDSKKYELKSTVIAVADELASTGELVMGKTSEVPVAIIRGYDFKQSNSGSKKLLRDPRIDLFR